MHLVHSAIRIITTNHHSLENNQQQQLSDEIILRYYAQQTTCDKYSREIAAIQKYLPGWTPALPTY